MFHLLLVLVLHVRRPGKSQSAVTHPDRSWTLVELLRSFSGQINIAGMYGICMYLQYFETEFACWYACACLCQLQGSAFKQVAKELSFMLQTADVNCGLVQKESKRLQSLLPLCATGAAWRCQTWTKDIERWCQFVDTWLGAIRSTMRFWMSIGKGIWCRLILTFMILHESTLKILTQTANQTTLSIWSRRGNWMTVPETQGL